MKANQICQSFQSL